MKKRLMRRLCAIMLAAVFLPVMTLSFVEPLQGILAVGAWVALMAVLMTRNVEPDSNGHDARAGPRTASPCNITADDLLAAIFGMARCAWPDPDQLTYMQHSDGRIFTTTRSQLAASVRTNNSFICGQTKNSAYNARDQSGQVMHAVKCDNTTASARGRPMRNVQPLMIKPMHFMSNPISPLACAA